MEYVVLLSDTELERVRAALVEHGIRIRALTDLVEPDDEAIETLLDRLERARKKYFPESKPVERRDAATVLRWAGGDPEHGAIDALIALSRSFQDRIDAPIQFLGRNLLRLIQNRTPADIIEWAENEASGSRASKKASRPTKKPSGSGSGNGGGVTMDRLRKAARKYAARPGDDDENGEEDDDF
jgi:hypothetical protein